MLKATWSIFCTQETLPSRQYLKRNFDFMCISQGTLKFLYIALLEILPPKSNTFLPHVYSEVLQIQKSQTLFSQLQSTGISPLFFFAIRINLPICISSPSSPSESSSTSPCSLNFESKYSGPCQGTLLQLEMGISREQGKIVTMQMIIHSNSLL